MKIGHHVPFYIFIFRLRTSFYKMSQDLVTLEITRNNLEIARINLEVSRNNLEAQKLANRTAWNQRLEKIEAGNAAIKVALIEKGIILIFYFV